MAILLIVLAPLTGSFASAETAQVDQTRRFDAQENARQALDRMRKDIHCAHGVTDPDTNGSGGETIVLTETNATGTAECPGLVQTQRVRRSSGAPSRSPERPTASGSTGRTTRTTPATGSASTFMVDYLTRADVWASPTCVSGQYPDG